MASLAVLPAGFEKAERQVIIIKDRAQAKDLLSVLNENGQTTETTVLDKMVLPIGSMILNFGHWSHVPAGSRKE